MRSGKGPQIKSPVDPSFLTRQALHMTLFSGQYSTAFPSPFFSFLQCQSKLPRGPHLGRLVGGCRSVRVQVRASAVFRWDPQSKVHYDTNTVQKQKRIPESSSRLYKNSLLAHPHPLVRKSKFYTAHGTRHYNTAPTFVAILFRPPLVPESPTTSYLPGPNIHACPRIASESYPTLSTIARYRSSKQRHVRRRTR
jgi:hypothetical protein